MPRLIAILIFLTGICFSVSAQDFFKSNFPVQNKGKALTLKFESTGFFKNNEYESSVAKGYTLTGTWLRPKLVFSPSGKVELELGWHYLKFNGAEKSTWSDPWFSAKINVLKNTKLILGNLNNNLNHRLIQPVWEPERFLTDKPEAGFQVLHNSENLFFDAWINWEQFITNGDPFQEHFTSGISLDYSFLKSGKIEFFVPVQILFHHQGGEIDSSPLKVQTLANSVIGLKSKILAEGFLREINLAGYYVTFNDSKGNAGLSFAKGSGWFFDGSVQTEIGKLGINYWDSKDFFGFKGMQLLQQNLNDSQKKMFSVYYDFQKEFAEGVVFGAKLEGWLEPEMDNFSNVAAIYLLVNQEFLLKRF